MKKQTVSSNIVRGVFIFIIVLCLFFMLSSIAPIAATIFQMPNIILIWIICSSIVLIFDAIWATISVRRNLKYGYGAIVSLLLYLLTGFIGVSFSGDTANIWAGGFAGMVVGIVDALFGTLIAYKIGAYGAIGQKQVLKIILVMLPIGFILGVSLGLFGGKLRF